MNGPLRPGMKSAMMGQTYISCVFSCFAESSPTNEWNNGILQPLNVICVYSLKSSSFRFSMDNSIWRELKMFFQDNHWISFSLLLLPFWKTFLLFLLVLMAHFFKSIYYKVYFYPYKFYLKSLAHIRYYKVCIILMHLLKFWGWLCGVKV